MLPTPAFLRFFIIITAVFQALAPFRQQPPALTVTPNPVQISGLLDKGTFSAVLQLRAAADLGGVTITASDLQDATGDARPRDPLSAAALSFLPAAQLETLPAGSLTQIIVQAAPPAQPGVYTGALTVRWASPTPGEISVPLKLAAHTLPVLAVQNPGTVAAQAERDSIVHRQVTLRETSGGAALAGLRATPQDLVAAQGSRAFPAGSITVTFDKDSIAAGDVVTADVQFNSQNVPPGRYQGQILLTSDAGEVIGLPAAVDVRDGPVWPWVAALLGTGLGLLLSGYQAKGRPRDKLLLRQARVRQSMRDDPDLSRIFGPGLVRLLDEASALMALEQWQEAGAAVQKAEGAVRRWFAAPRAWKEIDAYAQDKLLPRLDADDSLPYQRLKNEVEDLRSQAADFERPAEMQRALLAIETRLVRYENAARRIQALEAQKANMRLPEPVDSAWIRRIEDLRESLNALAPEDEDGWKRFEQDARQFADEVRAYIQAHPDEVVNPGRSGSEAAPASPEVMHLALGGWRDVVPWQVQTRLSAYLWVVYILSAALLAATAISTLYAGQPAFGANWPGDYLALFTWGLGAQTTFGSLVNLFRGWDIPFGRGSAEKND